MEYLGKYRYNLYFVNRELFSLVYFFEEDGNDIFIKAIQQGQLDAIKYIDETYCKRGVNPSQILFRNIGYNEYLKTSCEFGQLEITQYLISCGAKLRPNNFSAVSLTCKNGHIDTLKYFISIGANMRICNYYAIESAAEYGQLEIVKYLVVSIGVNIRINNHSPVRLASKNRTFRNC